MAEIKGKRVLITGGSSGIGQALAMEFARKEAVVALASRHLEGLERAKREFDRAFPRIPAPLVIPCDVTDKESVGRMIQSCLEGLGGVDIFVNNAGIGVYGDAERTSMEDLRSVMEVNFFGAVQCLLAVLPFMRKSGRGLIVNIASVAAKHGVPYLAAYGASKAALSAYSQSLRAELDQDGISLMIIYPGYTDTGFFAKEKKVGGAIRPPGPYAPKEKVAGAIVRAIEQDRQDLVLSFEGKFLSLVESIFPPLVESAMRRIAAKLRVSKEAV